MPVAPAAVGLVQLEAGLLTHEGLERQEGRGAQAIDLGPQGFGGVHGLVQAHTFNEQAAGRQGGFQLQQARALGDIQSRLQARQHGTAQ